MRTKKFPEIELGLLRVEAVTVVSLGFSYTLLKTNYDSYACQQIEFTSSKSYRLACRGDIVPFRSLRLNVRNGSCLLSRQEEEVGTRQ
jgi:hypothetical protein